MKPAFAHLQNLARQRAAQWLHTLDPSLLDTRHRATHGLALLLCERKICFLKLIQATGPAIQLPSAAALAAATRARLLRSMIAIVKAAKVHTTRHAREDLPLLLGALSVSYARSSDLTATAMILRAAGRLSLRGPLLDQACLFLLDQQSESGAFGLLSAAPTDSAFTQVKIEAQLQATLDILSALDAYSFTPH